MANVAAMGFADKNALVVAAYIIALNIVLELKDIELVGIAVAQAGDRIRPNMRRAFTLLSLIRRWVFLPALLMTVPWLVMFKGGKRAFVSGSWFSLREVAGADVSLILVTQVTP
jgi:hypothetical protein